MTGLLQDLRYAWRMLRKSPGFTAVFAADALSATAVLVKEKSDLVILDLGLLCGGAGIRKHPALGPGSVGHRLLSKTRGRGQGIVGHPGFLGTIIVGHPGFLGTIKEK